MFRVACLFMLAAQLVLLGLYLRPTGRSATAFTFVGTPLLAIGVLLAIVWVLRVYRRIRHAKVDRGDRDDRPVLRAS
jgi:hypothetical protein